MRADPEQEAQTRQAHIDRLLGTMSPGTQKIVRGTIATVEAIDAMEPQPEEGSHIWELRANLRAEVLTLLWKLEEKDAKTGVPDDAGDGRGV